MAGRLATLFPEEFEILQQTGIGDENSTLPIALPPDPDLGTSARDIAEAQIGDLADA